MKIIDLYEKGETHIVGDFDKRQDTRIDKKGPFGIFGKDEQKVMPPWSDDHREQIKSPEWKQRINNMLDRLPVHVDLFYVNTTPKKGYKFGMKKYDQEDIAYIKKYRRKNAICFIYSNNHVGVEDNAGKYSLIHGMETPWGVLHRISHEILNHGAISTEPASWRDWEVNWWVAFNRLISHYYGFNAEGTEPPDFWPNSDYTSDDYEFRQPPEKANIYSPFFTFKSARDKSIVVSSELITDANAQFLMTGSIKFNVPDEFLGHPLIDEPNAKAKVAKVLARLAKQRGNNIKKCLKKMRGKLYHLA